ncbi:MAG TPA: FkbM family methyltransferase [Gemmatimonadaceae bacterium]|nr:FkbM family methyltransferase [Gemmatimonadaceae bacterium]
MRRASRAVPRRRFAEAGPRMYPTLSSGRLRAMRAGTVRATVGVGRAHRADERASGTLSRIDRLYVAACRRSYRFGQRTNRPVTLQTPFGPVVVPIVQGAGLTLLHWDASASRRVEWLRALQRLQPGAVVDVGVNLGVYVIATALASPAIRYVGFEANAACVAYALQLIRHNALTAHTVLPIGLGDHTGTLAFQIADTHNVSGTAVLGFRPPAATGFRTTICVGRGDALLASLELEAISLVKIDVEGGELEVVRGLDETIRRHRPAMLVEVLPYQHLLRPGAERTWGPDAAARRAAAALRRERIHALDAELRRREYLTYRVHRDGRLEPLAHLDPGELADLQAVDHFCVPAERRDGFERAVGVGQGAAGPA